MNRPENIHEKYRSWPRFAAAYAYRESVRHRLSELVEWEKEAPLSEGCTAVIGVCARLSGILRANLKCLETARWKDLKETVLVVDTPRRALPEDFEDEIKSLFPSLSPRFAYYSEKQWHLAERFKLPHVYTWLSWSIGISLCRTRHLLIHDYDALVFGDSLKKRYGAFKRSESLIQGVGWHVLNGIAAEDRLVCPFEAFVDVEWAKSFKPVSLFNKIGKLNGWRVDYDILLDAQAHRTAPHQRTILKMAVSELVHPAQMIHQYRMFKKFPARRQNCGSIPMLPFYCYLGGDKTALRKASLALQQSNMRNIDFLGDGCRINFSMLERRHVASLIRQMVQTYSSLGITPPDDIFEYGDTLLRITGYQRSVAPASMRDSAVVEC